MQKSRDVITREAGFENQAAPSSIKEPHGISEEDFGIIQPCVKVGHASLMNGEAL